MVGCGSKNHDLFVAQRHHGIDLGGVPGGDVGCGQRSESNQRHNCGVSRRIGRPYFEQHALEQARGRDRCAQSLCRPR